MGFGKPALEALAPHEPFWDYIWYLRSDGPNRAMEAARERALRRLGLPPTVADAPWATADHWLQALAEAEPGSEGARLAVGTRRLWTDATLQAHAEALEEAFMVPLADYTDCVHTAAAIAATLKVRQAGLLAAARRAPRTRRKPLRLDFVSMVSHELRTPLAAIIGYAELMEDALEHEAARHLSEYVGHIQDSSRRLLALVEDLLDIAKLDSGNFRLVCQQADLVPVLQATAALVHPLVLARDVTLSVNVPETPVPMWLDPARIEQVLLNLVGNALKHSPPGGHIDVGVVEEAEGVRVTVRDDGPGMPPDVLPRLFERFYQVDASLSRVHGGAGLGLAIAKGLVEAHGGTIGVESLPGEGSCFHFTLPRGMGG